VAADPVERRMPSGDEVPDLRAALADLPPNARDLLRRVLIGDQADRDEVSYRLRRDRDEVGDELSDVIDLCTLYPEARRSRTRMQRA
jgi:hypothetical protein